MASKQHGVVTREQAFEAGATKMAIQHRLGTRRWGRLWNGVYRITGTPASHRQQLMAACFATGGVVSHRSAAGLLGVDGVKFRGVEISVVRARRRRPQGVIVHRVSDRLMEDVTVVDGIPVTTVERTIIDLAGIVPPRILESVLDDALRRNLVTMARLSARFDVLACRGRRGVQVMRRVIVQRLDDDEQESRFEILLGRVMARAGLPPPIPQYEVIDRGTYVGRFDYAYPGLLLGIEADSYKWHSSRTRWKTDRARGNRLMLLGWRVIHVTWEDLNERPDEVVALVLQAIGIDPVFQRRARPQR